MSGTSLEELLAVSFKGITNMINGKAWPKALRGLRIVMVALLEPIISSGKSSTGRLWIDCLIYPVLILNLFIRAESEENWHALKEFFYIFCRFTLQLYTIYNLAYPRNDALAAR